MKTLLALFTLVSLNAHAELRSSDLKACAFPDANKKVFTIPGKSGVVYKFKGKDVYKITLTPQAKSFKSTALAPNVCFDSESGEKLTAKDCKEARSSLKLDGYSLNEAYQAIMEDYKNQISRLMEDAGDTEPEDRYVEAGDAKFVIQSLQACLKLSPLSNFAKQKQTETVNAAEALSDIFNIAKPSEEISKNRSAGSAKSAR